MPRKKRETITIAKPVGNRSENRGHWTKGKRRNVPLPTWEGTLAELRVVFAVHQGNRNGISAHGLAHDLGCSDRAVRRWLAGEDVPATKLQRQVSRWVKVQQTKPC
jgi:ribosome-binding protein aMBF1 (putative translation factor)